ncbi:MAG: cation-transporting P-type ATPase [Proteobacteria bacterium]|nr:cation-transporting P-type ATPase [Pseudomonadota bacterium]
MAARNVLIRRLPAVEALGAATVICVDKTGTLTENGMTAARLFADGTMHELQGLPTANPAVRAVIAAAQHCHGVKEMERDGRRTLVGDSTELALVEMVERLGTREPAWPVVDRLPFDSDRKRLSVVCAERGDLMVYTKGAFETVMALCTRHRDAAGERPLDAAARQAAVQAHDALTQAGSRVLAFATRRLDNGYDRTRIEEDLVFVGLVSLDDPPRPEVPGAVATCRAAGIKIIMMTGDHAGTAAAIARQIGLTTREGWLLLTGAQLETMSDAELSRALGADEIVLARLSPLHKLRVVGALKANGEIVAMTGDGVNDAPALRRADVGIAMGATGTDVAREAADMVLVDDNFASIVAAIEEGRGVFSNIRKFLTYILSSNVPELVPFLAFALFGVPLALTAIQILAVDLGTDILPALGLGAERPERDIMRRPPRPRDQGLFDFGLLSRAYLVLGTIEAAVAMGAFFVVLNLGGWQFGAPLSAHDPLYLAATAACLAAIVVTQVANVLLCRSATHSLASPGFFANRLIFIGIAVEIAIILLIVYTPPGQLLFGTAAMSWEPWALAVAGALIMIAAEECRKFLWRRSGAAGRDASYSGPVAQPR